MIQAQNYNVPPPIISQQTSNNQQFQSLQFKPFKPPDGEFDGKRLRKSVMRKTVDYNSSIIQMLENRIWQRDERDMPALPADICYASNMLPPPAYLTNPINSVATKFVRTSTNKAKCPIFCLAWTPEGRRLVTGASSGEFTLWNGLTFNFETILQAHEKSVREMVWSNNDQWMATGDADGYIKYWQSNMNNVMTFQAHTESVRGLSFSPNNVKLASGSDDGTVRIWDFMSCREEKCLRGHGADVKCVAWHPSKSLLASGSKDNQQPIKLWDPRTGNSLVKLHAHKSTVMDLKWNKNGNWLCSASRDHLLKLFDVRNFSTELQVFRGHKKEAACIAWHPQHEGLFSSGGSDGSILFWHVGNDKELGMIESAHDGIVWDLAWHPLGHILCSGSNDHTSKFWTRNRVGDKMRDKYNLNTLPPGVVGDDCIDIDDIPIMDNLMPVGAIPGMGPDDKVEATEPEPKPAKVAETIPGLDFDGLTLDRFLKKTPYAKPIPKTFQAQWNAAGGLDEVIIDDINSNTWVVVESEGLFCKPAELEGDPVINDIGEELPPGSILLEDLKVNAIAYYGFYIPLPNATGAEIQDAFALMEEEEAISHLTNDTDFARKLIREKKGLYNPAANPGFEDVKMEDQKPKFQRHQNNTFQQRNNDFRGNQKFGHYQNKGQNNYRDNPPHQKENNQNFHQQRPNYSNHRGFRNDQQDRGFRNDQQDRGFRNDQQDRGFKNDQHDRGFKNDQHDRGFRNDQQDRGFRNDQQDRGFRNDQEDVKFFDRGNNQGEYRDEDRDVKVFDRGQQQRSNYGNHGGFRSDRQDIKYIDRGNNHGGYRDDDRDEKVFDRGQQQRSNYGNHRGFKSERQDGKYFDRGSSHGGYRNKQNSGGYKGNKFNGKKRYWNDGGQDDNMDWNDQYGQDQWGGRRDQQDDRNWNDEL